MEMSLADQDHAITILPLEAPATQDALGAISALPKRTSSTARRPAAAGRSKAVDAKARKQPRPAPSADVRTIASDEFYRDMVWSLRNGVLAVTW